ncbi:MAG: uncharacterized membrane protein YqaE (UPF0057 family) [Arenicella sp.]|jgi:uncharacterized membrane protein YqaE (UPF0057 family)
MRIRLGFIGVLTFLLSSFSFGQELEGSLVEGVLEQEAGVYSIDESSNVVANEENNSRAKVDQNLASRPIKTKRAKVKVKDIVKAIKKAKKVAGGVDVMTILLIILAIVLPPLAVGIFEGITGRFWLVLVLWLLGWVAFGILFFIIGGLAGLCALAAVVLALLIVLGVW